MRSRWISMLALVALAGLALAMAAPVDRSQTAAADRTTVATSVPDATTTAGDPYLADSPFGTEAPIPMVRCQVYAYQCVYQGGPCGPGTVCHCAFDQSTGWICGGYGGGQ